MEQYSIVARITEGAAKLLLGGAMAFAGAVSYEANNSVPMQPDYSTGQPEYPSQFDLTKRAFTNDITSEEEIVLAGDVAAELLGLSGLCFVVAGGAEVIGGVNDMRQARSRKR